MSHPPRWLRSICSRNRTSSSDLSWRRRSFLVPVLISHDWDMEGWTAKRVERMDDGTGRIHTLYLWVMGEQYGQ